MLMPALVEPTLTLEHTTSVTARASGIAAMSFLSPSVIPSRTNDYVPFAQAMDKAAKAVGVNFIGGYSALVQKGFAHGDELLLRTTALRAASFRRANRCWESRQR